MYEEIPKMARDTPETTEEEEILTELEDSRASLEIIRK